MRRSPAGERRTADGAHQAVERRRPVSGPAWYEFIAHHREAGEVHAVVVEGVGVAWPAGPGGEVLDVVPDDEERATIHQPAAHAGGDRAEIRARQVEVGHPVSYTHLRAHETRHDLV